MYLLPTPRRGAMESQKVAEDIKTNTTYRVLEGLILCLKHTWLSFPAQNIQVILAFDKAKSFCYMTNHLLTKLNSSFKIAEY